jgi:hypothetical protein
MSNALSAGDQGPRARTGTCLISAAVIAAMFGLGVWSFYVMYAAFGVPLTRCAPIRGRRRAATCASSGTL